VQIDISPITISNAKLQSLKAEWLAAKALWEQQQQDAIAAGMEPSPDLVKEDWAVSRVTQDVVHVIAKAVVDSIKDQL
jgi:hypothetical protein